AEIANRLNVAIPDQRLRTDGAIKQAAAEYLAWDAEVPNAAIQVTVAGGVVTLEGHVDYEFQRDVAERVVQHLTGVRGVVNKLAVGTPLAHGLTPPRADLLAWHPVHVPHASASAPTPR